MDTRDVANGLYMLGSLCFFFGTLVNYLWR